MTNSKLILHWNTIDIQTKAQLLSWACMNSNLENYEWCEIEKWEQDIINDCLSKRSKNTVEVKE